MIQESMKDLGAMVGELVAYAQALAHKMRDGDLHGRHFTKHYMSALNEWVLTRHGRTCIEPKLGRTRQSPDYFLPSEKTVIEVELGLAASHNSLERDVFKSLIAKDSGADISTLLLLGGVGSKRRHAEPASRAVINWARERCNLAVLIHEL